MDFIKKVEYLDWLIRQGSTGTAEQLAEKLKVSPRSVFYYIKWMKEHGAPIAYSRQTRSYIYTKEVEFIATFKSKDQSQDQEGCKK